jgi:hypothetical protein
MCFIVDDAISVNIVQMAGFFLSLLILTLNEPLCIKVDTDVSYFGGRVIAQRQNLLY